MPLFLPQRLHERLRAAPDRPALIDLSAGARVVTAGELDAAALAWAAHFEGYRRVGLLGPNDASLAAAFLGALAAGAAVVPFHAHTPPAELRARVERFAVDHLVVLDEGAPRTRDLGAPSPAGPKRAPLAAPVDVTGDAPALLLGTSGTTGEPRAVVIDHRGLAAHTAALVPLLGLGPDDRVLATLPLAHSYGCRMALLAPLLSGATVVIVRGARASLAALQDHALTWAPLVPTMLSAWVALPGPPCPSLRWVLSAGAPLPTALREQARARLGCDVREGYGLTEASFSTLDAPPAAPAPGSVGPPVPGVELRLAPDGEVQVRGPNVMAGYLDEPDGTRAAFTADGWLMTGDLGALDADGRLRIFDRKKHIILRGGYTIHPAEVEAALLHHPDVVAVAVVGRPHAHLGEEVVAHVVARPGREPGLAARLTDWSTMQLAPHKVPAEVVLRAELPLGPSGKVLKRHLG